MSLLAKIRAARSEDVEVPGGGVTVRVHELTAHERVSLAAEIEAAGDAVTDVVASAALVRYAARDADGVPVFGPGEDPATLPGSVFNALVSAATRVNAIAATEAAAEGK